MWQQKFIFRNGAFISYVIDHGETKCYCRFPLNCSYSTSLGQLRRSREQKQYVSFRNLDVSRTGQKKKRIKICHEIFCLSVNLLLKSSSSLTSSRTIRRTWANTRPKPFLIVFWKYWPPFAVGYAERYKFKHSLSKLASFYPSCKSQSVPLPWWRWLPPCKPSPTCQVSINELSELLSHSWCHTGKERGSGAQCALRICFNSLYISFPCCLPRLFYKNDVHVSL